MAGIVLIGGGAVAASIGSAWQATAAAYLYGYAITQLPELYLPYWPFEPFLPLAIIMLGTILLSSGGGAAVERATQDRGARSVAGA